MKPPALNAEHLGAVVDALATTNALMFMSLASQEESDAVLGLLEKMEHAFDQGSGLDQLRGMVMHATVKAMRDMQSLREGKLPVGGARTQ
ncbi:hypothetical protein [Pseudoxanthomonas sp. SE1]|uniref:hypothetical protein n=1 Tax=Pseudoxanthomonas sp. SE1 TaxID=1664560 RepID=UPI00240D1450|nr:hypothetical protein [Pseudoxanthomonas sp. SE1]WFC43765.1 hypothetical protein OY559_09840 [Pseudoxanthomonas sp. SE1]